MRATANLPRLARLATFLFAWLGYFSGATREPFYQILYKMADVAQACTPRHSEYDLRPERARPPAQRRIPFQKLAKEML